MFTDNYFVNCVHCFDTFIAFVSLAQSLHKIEQQFYQIKPRTSKM